MSSNLPPLPLRICYSFTVYATSFESGYILALPVADQSEVAKRQEGIHASTWV